MLGPVEAGPAAANACANQCIDAYNRCAEAKGYATGRLPHDQPLTPLRGPMSEDADARPPGPQTPEHEGIRNLRPVLAEGFSEVVGDRGDGEPDQRSSGAAPDPASRSGEADRGMMAPDCPHG